VYRLALEEEDRPVGEGSVRLVPEVGQDRLALGVDLQPLGGERPHGRIVRAHPERLSRTNSAPEEMS
jgi:hypothetical protein